MVILHKRLEVFTILVHNLMDNFPGHLDVHCLVIQVYFLFRFLAAWRQPPAQVIFVDQHRPLLMGLFLLLPISTPVVSVSHFQINLPRSIAEQENISTVNSPKPQNPQRLLRVNDAIAKVVKEILIDLLLFTGQRFNMALHIHFFVELVDVVRVGLFDFFLFFLNEIYFLCAVSDDVESIVEVVSDAVGVF